MKKTLSFLLLMVIQTALSQRDYTFIYQTDSIIKAGTVLHDNQKYSDAIKEYEKISKSDPQYASAQYEIALSLYQLDDKQKVGTFLKECFEKKLAVKEPSLYVLYGSFLSDQKEYDQAEKIFKEAMTVTPNNSILLYNYAILKLRNKDNQGAIDLLKKTLTIDPNYSSAHYFLGIMAFESGRITEGSLALLSYLVNEPTGRYAEKCIEYLNVKMGENYLQKDALVYSNSGDDFTEIDEILRNQLPLKKAYKVNSDFDDDPMMRQLQAICEYSLEHKMGDGFFENAYIPWIKKVMQDHKFEAMSYYILLSKEQQIGKKLTNKKKDILSFADYLTKGFWNYFALRKVEHFGKIESVMISIKNGRPYGVGAVINDKREGKFKTLDRYGRVIAELNYKNGELDGIQKFYYEDGQLKTENEFKDGKLNGTRKDYYTNGMPSLEQRFKNDQLNGISTSYFVNGGKNCEVNFTDDERDGKLVCTYQNGSLKTEETYVKGKLNGTHISYNEVGDVVEKYNAVNNLIEGNYVSYYDGKIIKEEAVYVNGKINGHFKSYFPNQSLDEDKTYVDGNIKLVLGYLASGKLVSETQYDDNGRIAIDIYYDAYGNKFFEEKYDKGEIKSGLQFSKVKPKPTVVSLSKKPYTIASFEGKPLITGEYTSGNKNSDWKFYYSSGNVKTKQSYRAGVLNGLSTKYNFNTTLNQIGYYKDGKLNGVYEDYDDGILEGVYHFVNDERNGPSTYYAADGSVLLETFYEDGDENHDKVYYRFDGTIRDKSKMINGYQSTSEKYDKNGNLESSVNFKNKNETLKLTRNNGVIIQSMQLVNGELNGKYTQTDKFNNLLIDEEYVNNMNVKTYKSYSPAGTVQIEQNYYCGKLHGLQKWFDLLGNLRSEEEYLFGEQYGKDRRYYQNKKIFCEENYIDDLRYGETTYFNLKGEPILKLGYINNSLQYYIKLGKSGAVDDKIEIADETAQIQSVYPNGKIAMSLNIDKGNFEGKVNINSAEGNPVFESTYLHDLNNGERIEYYENGKVYKKEHIVNGNLEGTQEYFSEDGKLLISAQYKSNKRHGETIIFTKTGKTIKKYDTDELVEIK